VTLFRQARDGVGRAVRALRLLFEDEFGKQASGRFGIRNAAHVNSGEVDSLSSWLDPVESLSLTPVEVSQRDELVRALRYLCAEGLSGGEAVQRLIREAAFTAVNRLLAVRVAEALGVVPQVLAHGRQSAGYRDTVRDLFPVLAHDDGSYWTYVQVAGDELAAGVPRLFDRRSPASAFVPSRACIDNALELVNTPDLEEVWAEPETLGWGYQFFNGDDVAQMRAQSAQPRNSRELAVRNQFFTPRYVVDWLVQNTLGRRLAQAGYYVALPLLVGEIGDAQALSLDDVRVLDPAVGSGHFLLGCYDLLEEAWKNKGLSADEAAPKILPCLFGVDIDPRAAQVAQAVLLLRARRAAPAVDLAAPTIATAVALPHSPELQREAFGELSSNARDLAREITDALSQAPQLGTLLKVEQRLALELDRIRATPSLADDADEATVLQELDQALEHLVTATSTPEERMFTADAEDALRFLAICQQRYDAVLMNPPFGPPIPDTRDYLRAAYDAAATDLYAAFVARGVELLKPGGYIGAITSRTGFFLTTFQQWRAKLLLPRLRAMLDLGIGVMHEAMVEAAAYVLQRQPHDGTATFRRLLDEPDKATAVYNGTGPTYQRQPNDFTAIPEQPTAYWASDSLLAMFIKESEPGAIRTDIKQGLATADDFRFVRLWWEVPAEVIGLGGRWYPFAKGGDYSPYYSDLHLVVDWEEDGQRIREWGQGRAQNTQFYTRPGLTWSRRSQKGFSARTVPANCVFGDKGPMLFVNGDSADVLTRLLGYLNSAAAAAAIEAMVAFGSYEVGAIGRLPTPDPAARIADPVLNISGSRQREAERDETSHSFIFPSAGLAADRVKLVTWSQQIDQIVADSLEQKNQVVPVSATYPTLWFEDDFEPVAEPGTHEELSYLVGVVFGRWDIRYATGEVEPSPLPGPFEPLPAVSRGMLVSDDGLPASTAPLDYSLALPADRVLHDDPGHPADIVAAVEVASTVLQESGLKLLVQSEIRDLRRHLRDRFFPAHLSQYSASRRSAPIYWQLAVPSKRWGLWLYAPSLCRESLFAISRAANDKLGALNDRITQIQQQPRSGNERESREQIESLEELTAEIEKFAATADEVAQSGWEPDLNDGSALNAAPLEPLFIDRTWKAHVSVHRKALEEGNYPWATVQTQYYRSPQ
jgi:hypothetical protein